MVKLFSFRKNAKNKIKPGGKDASFSVHSKSVRRSTQYIYHKFLNSMISTEKNRQQYYIYVY